MSQVLCVLSEFLELHCI